MKAEACKFYGQFFELNRRQYIIPVYQRNYDWTIEECNKLFDDIILSFENEKPHFIGSIIQVQKDEEHGIKPFIVIDGQQRLTTIYLLLSALLEIEENQDRREVLHDSVYNKFREETPKDATDKYKLKLKANTNDNIQLIKLMSNKKEEMDTTSNIHINYENFKKRIRESKYTPFNIRKGIEQLVCVVISLKESDGDDPQVIFERINSTGLDLGLDDLVRNYVLMTAINQEELFVDYWSKIEEAIPKKERPSFITDYLDAYTNYPINAKNSYENFKKMAKLSGDNREEILKTLTKFSKYYGAFVNNSLLYSQEVNKKLDNLRKLDQSTVYTFLFYIFDDFENKLIDEPTLLKVLTVIETYSVRRMICEVPSSSLRGLYKNLYKRVFGKIDNPYKDYCDIFVSFLTNQLIGTKDEFPSDAKFRQYLKTTRIYRNRKLTKFLLGTLENHNSNEKIDIDSNLISIEHILPQNFENKDWRKDLGDEYENIYNTYLDTLGNITLTGYNSALSDNSFKKKQEILKNTKTKIKYLNKEFVESDKWDDEVILARADRISNDVISIFNYPKYSGTDYHPRPTTTYFIVDLENTEVATNTEPVIIEFFGEKREVNSYRAVVKNVIETLYLLDENIMRTLAIEKFRPMKSDKIYLTTEKKDIRLHREINNSGIFYDKNLSAVYSLEFIKHVLYEYGVDLDVLTISCKKKEIKN